MSGGTPPRRGVVVARAAWNWLNLSTPLGFGVALVGRARIRRGERGLWLAEGYRYRFPTGGAFTVGDVVTTAHPSFADLARGIPRILDHEERHTWQYAYCCGLPYLPIYVVLMGWSWLRTGDRASANFFERQAGLADGGYRESPPRSLAAGVRAALALLTRRRGGRDQT